MHVALHHTRGWRLAGLLAFLVCGFGSQAFGQTATRSPAIAPPNQLRPHSSNAVRSLGYAPKHTRLASTTRVVTQDDIVEGGTYMEDPQTGQLLETGPMAMPFGKSEVSKGAMMEPMLMDESCGDVCLTPCDVVPIGNLELFAGVQGFTGPRNRGGSGSFGFNEGLNYAIPLPGFACMGGQIGFRATQSSLSGAEFTDNARNQGFVTAGLFRRVDVGLQGGLVLDYLTESWYSDVDMTNVRGELSWVIDGVHDFGFWFSTGTNGSDVIDVEGQEEESWVGTDLYAFFYRLQFGGCRDGEARIFGGWTSESDGLIGIDARLPLGANWALESNFAYLIPNQGTGQGLDAGHAQESWNVGINVVWYPGSLWGAGDYYYRPLFRVADNGNFMVDRSNAP